MSSKTFSVNFFYLHFNEIQVLTAHHIILSTFLLNFNGTKHTQQFKGSSLTFWSNEAFLSMPDNTWTKKIGSTFYLGYLSSIRQLKYPLFLPTLMRKDSAILLAESNTTKLTLNPSPKFEIRRLFYGQF